MTDTLQAIAAKIAATGKWVPKPGHACVDPDTGTQWRLMFSGPTMDNWSAVNGPGVGIEISRRRASPVVSPDLARALAGGPDLSDDVTALSLLADLPDAQVVRIGTHWRVDVGADRRGFGATRAEAIARAWLAVHEEAK
jgi:hypothetical protein